MWINSGCAIQYYDRATETEHLWGFGHMKMKLATPEERVRATVKGLEIIGVGAGLGKERSHVTIGWSNDKHLEVIDENTTVRFEWPTSDFFKVRVGSEPPLR